MIKNPLRLIQTSIKSICKRRMTSLSDPTTDAKPSDLKSSDPGDLKLSDPSDSNPSDPAAEPVLSKNQEKNEAKRLAKMAKFLAKQTKQTEEVPAKPKAIPKKTVSEEKPVAVKEDVVVPETPEGEKKGNENDFIMNVI